MIVVTLIFGGSALLVVGLWWGAALRRVDEMARYQERVKGEQRIEQAVRRVEKLQSGGTEQDAAWHRSVARHVRGGRENENGS